MYIYSKKNIVLSLFFVIYLSIYNVQAYDVAKDSDNNGCAKINNYYERAMCALDYIKAESKKDFNKSSGIYGSCSQANKVIYKYWVDKAKGKSNVSEYLTDTNDAHAKCNISNDRSDTFDSVDISNQISMMFVNGDDNDISKYDIIYELSKVEAMFIGAKNINRKLSQIKNTEEKDSNPQGDDFKMDTSLNQESYDKSVESEKVNSIYGHITYMQKAMEAINKKTLLTRIVTGFPFIPGNATERNIFFRLSIPILFVPVTPPENPTKRFEDYNPLDLSNIKTHLLSTYENIKSGLDNTDDVSSAFDKLKDIISISDNTADELTDLSASSADKSDNSKLDIDAAIDRHIERWENIKAVDDKIIDNSGDNAFLDVAKDIVGSMDYEITGLIMNGDLMDAEFLVLDDMHNILYEKVQSDNQEKDDMLNTIQGSESGIEEIRREVTYILNEIKSMNKQMRGIGESIDSWAMKN